MNARMKKLTTEAAAVLDELGKDRLDPESDHCKADEVLLEYLDAIIEELERDIAQVTKDADGYARDVIRLHGRIEGLETAVADALRAPSDRGVK